MSKDKNPVELKTKKFNDAIAGYNTKQADSLHQMIDSAYNCIAFVAYTNRSLQADCAVIATAIDNLHEKI